MYRQWFQALNATFASSFGRTIVELQVGLGPCGELRYPSYVEANGWRFPGVGEFQCYDRRALAQLAVAADAAGHPEWGYAGPHNAGAYNSAPEDTGFFATHDGSWDSAYGRFFLEWYSGALLAHGERMLQAAAAAFGAHMKKQPGSQDSLGWPRPAGNGAAEGGTSQGGKKALELTLKIAGIHWYYRTASHAAELTAGYYNTAQQNGYAALVGLCAKHGANITLTCVEMCDAQHPAEASCSPEALLHQVRRTAADMGVAMSGENALPCISAGGVDTKALDRIIRNTTAFDPAHDAAPSNAWGSFAPSSVSMQQLRGSVGSSSSNSSISSCADMSTESSAAVDADAAQLPAMRSFTFLRLNQEMIAPAYQGVWMRFMQRMHAAEPSSS